MSLRRRIALLSAGSVAVAVALCAVAAYAFVRAELRREVDAALTRQASFAMARVGMPQSAGTLPAPPPRDGGPIAYAQLVRGGDVMTLSDAPLRLPVDEQVREIADDEQGHAFSDAVVNDSHLRVIYRRDAAGRAQLARSLDGADDVLSRLRIALLALCVAGVGDGGAARPRRSDAASSRRSARWRPPRTTSPRRRTSSAASRRRAPTRSASWPPSSTRCSTRSTARSTPSASSSRTPPTSCARP